MNELVIASNNQHKINEIKHILKNYNIKIYSLKDLNIKIDVEETGKTFLENAHLKAMTIYEYIKKPVLSDDSGLEVFALNNEPGIYSARYSLINNYNKYDNIDLNNNNLLLEKLLNVQDRKARYVCSMVLIINDNCKFEIEDYMNGIICKKACGTHGFGYDPIFFLEKYQKTVAQIAPSLKNTISHRAKALNKLAKIIEENNLCQ